jgi:AAA15 family ATPase/GTPase
VGFGTEERTQFDVLSQSMNSNEMKKKSLLADLVMRTPWDSEAFKPFHDAFDWFFDLIIIYPETRYGGMGNIMRDNKRKSVLEKYLNYFDTGIDSLTRIERDFEKAFSDMPKEVKIKLEEMLLDGNADIGHFKVKLNGIHYEMEVKEGEIVVYETAINHGNEKDLFSYSDESDGTQRLFDLIPVFGAANNNHVVVIDEIDRSFHSKLLLEFISKFYEVSEKFNSQLIVTTHDLNVFDLNVVRQDELWLMERETDKSSKLKPLSKYKPRFDKTINPAYLDGRYGAVPEFNPSKLIENEDDEGGDLP